MESAGSGSVGIVASCDYFDGSSVGGEFVTLVSKAAVSPTSQSAELGTWQGQKVWKHATRQTLRWALPELRLRRAVPYPTVMACAILFGSLLHVQRTLAAGCPAPSFQAPGPFAVGLNPVAVAVDDFNGDGKLDLAAANQQSGNISVLLGKGDGLFENAVNYTTGTYPQFVAVGEFNGDGKLDLAVANNSAQGTVSLLLGNGNGVFQAAVNYNTGSSPSSLVVGDFNGDHKDDLAIANDAGISVLLGNGDGTFKTAVNYGAGRNPAFVTAGDFNGDGKTDLAVPNDFGISVLLGNGDGTFQTGVSYQAGTGPSSVAAGDLNGDGRLDLAVANVGSLRNNYTNGSVSILLGRGDGTFENAVNYNAGTAPSSVAVGDFNGDGKPDLAVATEAASVLIGNGDGTFQAAASFAAGSSPIAVATGDFNSDGQPDLAVANYNTDGTVSVLKNACVSAAVNLVIARTGSSVTVSWPFPSTGFILESKADLNLTGWQPATGQLMTNNGLLELTIPLNQRERYFRLHKP
jgi:hypothetical protein